MKGQSPMQQNFNPRLIADIGGTNARFGIEVAPFEYTEIKKLSCADYPTLSNAILSYLEMVNLTGKIHHASLAIPSPIAGNDDMFMVNSPWNGQSMSKVSGEVGMKKVIFLNDFHALALSIPNIKQSHLVKIGGHDQLNLSKTISIIGPGTGLGAATLIKHPTGRFFSVPAEYGRSSFAPANEEEIELWKFVNRRYSHVSTERFISGPGLQLIYEALCSIRGIVFNSIPTPAEIVTRGLTNQEWMFTLTIDIFCRMLGTAASNLVVTTCSFGGAIIGGGIIPQMIEFFVKSGFRGRFEAKGRFHEYLAQIPVYVIMEKFPAFLGASYALETFLQDGYIP